MSTFPDAIREAGLGSPNIIAEGEIHRFRCEGDHKDSRNGWYVYYPDGIPAGAFGSWKSGLTTTWRQPPPPEDESTEDKSPSLTVDEALRAKQAVERARRARKADRLKGYERNRVQGAEDLGGQQASRSSPLPRPQGRLCLGDSPAR
jgi:putative DNA primase/helicase